MEPLGWGFVGYSEPGLYPEQKGKKQEWVMCQKVYSCHKEGMDGLGKEGRPAQRVVWTLWEAAELKRMKGRREVLKGSSGTNELGEEVTFYLSMKSWKDCKIFQGSYSLSSWIRRFNFGEIWAVVTALGVVPFSFYICFTRRYTMQSSRCPRPQQLGGIANFPETPASGVKQISGFIALLVVPRGQSGQSPGN